MPAFAVDRVVNWPNASLRDPSELPDIRDTPFGIVLEDPLEAAFSQSISAPEIEPPAHQQPNGQPPSLSGRESSEQPHSALYQQQQQQQQTSTLEQQQTSTLEQQQALPASQEKQQMRPSLQQQVPMAAHQHQQSHQAATFSSSADSAMPQQADLPTHDQQGALEPQEQHTPAPPQSLADELKAAGQGTILAKSPFKSWMF